MSCKWWLVRWQDFKEKVSDENLLYYNVHFPQRILQVWVVVMKVPSRFARCPQDFVRPTLLLFPIRSSFPSRARFLVVVKFPPDVRKISRSSITCSSLPICSASPLAIRFSHLSLSKCPQRFQRVRPPKSFPSEIRCAFLSPIDILSIFENTILFILGVRR